MDKQIKWDQLTEEEVSKELKKIKRKRLPRRNTKMKSDDVINKFRNS